MADIVVLTARIPSPLRDQLKAKYWSQADKHQQSYNAWLRSILEKAAK